MKLEIVKSHNKITDIDTWYKYAKPMGKDKQWKDGKSAKEFARYMTHDSKTLPKEIAEYLEDLGIKSKSVTCYPEFETSFAGYNLGRGSGRHHDADIKDIHGLRYQLIAATVGILIEADKAKVDKAVFLVIEIVPGNNENEKDKKTRDENRNDCDWKAFLKFLRIE